jgi:imidazole glycerol phosphate synthase subunit HisF
VGRNTVPVFLMRSVSVVIGSGRRMLKRRIIALLTLRDGVLTRTKKFVPDYIYTKNQVNTEYCDEICCLRIGGSWSDFFAAVNHISDEAMLPVTVGGGIETLDDAKRCFRETVADKVVVETHFGKCRKCPMRNTRVVTA